jgi:hypothetical protein
MIAAAFLPPGFCTAIPVCFSDLRLGLCRCVPLRFGGGSRYLHAVSSPYLRSAAGRGGVTTFRWADVDAAGRLCSPRGHIYRDVTRGTVRTVKHIFSLLWTWHAACWYAVAAMRRHGSTV